MHRILFALLLLLSSIPAHADRAAEVGEPLTAPIVRFRSSIALSKGWLVIGHDSAQHQGAVWINRGKYWEPFFQGASQGANGTILFSADSGKTWIKQSSGLKENIVSIVGKSTTELLITGVEAVALLTKDGGATWVDTSRSMP